ncbi:MAG TPA: GMC family oxidoreductase N-terminal domain-containing protein [Burkholderiales bacterium]|jgi:choline dehydrogenase|nr:GMC family oxidoreductase N-terminal domain-containing protein [Burkholderiales bacterium]
MYVTSLPDGAEFDYVVCGAGASGCVVAERLSGDGKNSVLLIEAGPPANSINIKIPLFVANILNDANYTWPYMTEPQVHLNNKPQRWTRGRVIGGSGSINGNLFVRGDPQEYDHWRDSGCTGWGYADMLPIFKRLEDFPEGNAGVRGSGGPIHCTRLDKFDRLSDAFIGACSEAGYRELPDYNDGSYEGVFYLQYSTRRGLRNSSAAGYLKPARNRSNLTIITDATVARVLLEGKRATGVEYIVGNTHFKVKARKEISLSAGPLASPQILELSGIGNEAILKAHGIEVQHHLPGVGENLRDHPNTRITFECAQPITINDVLRSPMMKMREGARFIFKREGLLTICSATAQMNYRSDQSLKQPDLVLRLLPLSGADRYARTPKKGMDLFPGFTFGITVLQPKSRGTLHIQSRDPKQQAAMDPKYLSNEEDAQLFLKAFKLSREVAKMPALKPMVVRETRPGPNVLDEKELMGYIRDTIQTSWHMVGTTKMGVDDMAVVDPQLRVRGIEGLRVIDSGICPTIPSSNTNVPSIAIGEKGADFMLAA